MGRRTHAKTLANKKKEKKEVKRLGWILLGFFGCIVLIYLVRRSATAQVIEEERGGGITLTQRAFMPLEERGTTVRAYEPIPTPTPITPISPTQDVHQAITDQPATRGAVAGASWLGRTAPIWDIPKRAELPLHRGIRR